MLTMISRCQRVLLTLAVFAALIEPARAEARQDEFVPELNVFIKLSKQVRLFLLGDVTQGFSPSFTDGELGAHLDFTLKPILRRELRHGDWERSRYLWVRAGYVMSSDLDDRDDPTTHMILLEGTARLELPGKIGW